MYGGDADQMDRARAHAQGAVLPSHGGRVGAPAYQSALAEANLGISSNAGDYIANFSGSQALESNPWWQFVDADGSTGRAGDLVARPFTLSNAHDVAVGSSKQRLFRMLGCTTRADFSASVRENPTYPQPFVTFNENLLIKAEAQFQTGRSGRRAHDVEPGARGMGHRNAMA